MRSRRWRWSGRRGDGPALLVAETFRMGGHATHDVAEARRVLPPELFARWGRRDPIGLYEEHSVEIGVPPATSCRPSRMKWSANVEQAERDALDSRQTRMPAPEQAVLGVYADREP